MTTVQTTDGTMATRRRRIRHIGAISHGGLTVAAKRAVATRRELSPAATAALVEHARRVGALPPAATPGRPVAPGTVLKAGSPELRSADIWTLLLAGPERPRLVKD